MADSWFNPPQLEAAPDKTHRIVGILSAALQGALGQPSTYLEEELRRRQDQRGFERSLILEQLQAMNADQRSATDRAERNADWTMQEQWKLDHPAQPEAVRIAQAAGLAPGTPEYKSALTAAIPGYGNTQPVLAMKAQNALNLAAARAANSASLKAQPTYGQLHPRTAAPKPPKPPAGFILD